MIEWGNNGKREVLFAERCLCTRESPRVGRLQEMMVTNERGGGKQHETYMCFLLRASFQERNTSFSFVAVFGWFNVLHFGRVAATSDEQIKNFPVFAYHLLFKGILPSCLIASWTTLKIFAQMP